MYIAVTEDDLDQRALLSAWLTELGHTVAEFDTVAASKEGLNDARFDLLLIDWVLPDGTGAELLKWVRANLGWDTPVLVLTARDDEITVVEALQAGADDYVVKPAKPRELMARVSALARRGRSGALPILRLGAYEIDVGRQSLMLDGQSIPLTQKEFDLTVYLFQNPGKLMSRDHLLNKVWGLNADVDTRTVDTHVSRLRKKLALDGANGWKMVPVYGVGYRFERLAAALETT